MDTLIVGRGEIGKSLYSVLKDSYNVNIVDISDTSEMLPGIMHICFPYSERFVEQVKAYQKYYEPTYTIIHSTVPVGVSKKCNAIHSPCVGIHPHLAKSLKTFTKFLGGEKASEVAQYFRRAGINIYLFDKSETTELMKVLSTSFYGLLIEWTKEVKRQCEKYDVPFEAWTLWTNNYNRGYNLLGYPEYTRPNLIPIKTKIGGHCIIPNLDFLEGTFFKLIKELNNG